MLNAHIAYTIGHSNHSTEKLLALLAMHGVTAVADVRSQPYSRFNPQFNRETLSAALHSAGIAYVYLGWELGARAADKSCYREGKVQYDILARTALFREGLDRLVHGLATHRVALMCAEREPLHCHRAILISRHLAARGIEIQHILEDGSLESHDHALSRLLLELDMEESELFRSRDELVAEAYARRGEQIAYSTERRTSNTTE